MSRNLKAVLVVVLVFGIAWAVAGLAEDAKVIAVVSICASCTGEARAMSGLREAAEAKGWTMQIVDGAGDFNRITSAIETFIESKVDAIILGATDPAPLQYVISKANAAGIPFLAESGQWFPGITVQVGQDPFRLGQIQGSYIVDRLRGKGKVIIFTYRPATNVAMREDIVRTIFSFYPDIEIIETHNLDIARVVEDARRTMETWLLRYPPGEIDAVWCGWDDPALGATTAIDMAGRNEIFLIGNDAGPEALDKIRDPESAWDVTVFIDYVTIGKLVVEQLEKIFSGEGADAFNVYIDQPVITADNVPPPGEMPPAVGSYTLYELSEPYKPYEE